MAISGAETFLFELTRSNRPAAPTGDRRLGSLPENPFHRRDDAVQVASGQRLDIFSQLCIIHDTDYLTRRPDYVAEAADQLAAVLATNWDAVVRSDQPAQHAGSAVGPVLAVAAQPPLVRLSDLGLDVGPTRQQRR